jgi:O-acetyl-ADP-ribose deacetylase (regulator of RNase III)
MIEVEVLAADVTKLEVDAIANAANTQLKHGGGVARGDRPRRWPTGAAGVEREGPDRSW